MVFKIADVLIPTIVGGITGYYAFQFVSPGWNMMLAMLVGMLVGMAAQIPVILIGMPLFGAFEIMLPAMSAGMLSGMLSGMLASKFVLPGGVTFLFGSGIGVLVILYIQIQNRKLKGEVN
ncbi:MAG: hypothetical protein R6X10_10080 [Desulfobacterales bacterium]